MSEMMTTSFWQQNVMYNSAIPTSLFSQQAQRLFRSLVSQNTNSIRHESPLKFEALVSNYDKLLNPFTPKFKK